MNSRGTMVLPLISINRTPNRSLLRAAGVPLILLPQKLGPFRDPACRAEAVAILRRAAAVWVRDAESFAFLQDALGDDFDAGAVVTGLRFGGGISDAVRVARACRERGLAFSPHTWSNGFSMMVNLHVHAACGDDHPLEYPLEPPGWIPEYRDAPLAEPLLADANGTIAIPDRPGLGIDIDEDLLARHGEKFFDLTSKGLAVKTVREKGLFTALKLARKKRRRSD